MQLKALEGADGSRHIVEGWLNRLRIEHSLVEESMEGYLWGLVAVTPNQDALQIGWRDTMEALQVQATVVPDEAERVAFGLMSAPSKLAFLADVVIGVSGMALNCMIAPPDDTEDDASPVTTPPGIVYVSTDIVLVDNPILCSDFTPHLMKVIGAGRLVTNMFSKMAVVRRWS